MEPVLQKGTIEDQLQLAAKAAQGVVAARASVNKMLHPVINYQTSRFCKRFCRENQYRFRCTLAVPQGSPPRDASLCEWGNASYGWMLDDLASNNRLLKYSGRNDSSLFNYLCQIANSLPFYERWKDWRFGRKIHVPTYVQDLGPSAARIFLALRSNQDISMIAQNLNMDAAEVEVICQQIIILLTKKKRLYLLNPDSTISLTSSGADDAQENAAASQADIASYDESVEHQEEKQQLQKVWTKLTPVEQFIIEALVIEEQDASHVLTALKSMGISIKKGVAANDTSRQQLYYFRRKTLAKLADLLKMSEKHAGNTDQKDDESQ